MGDSMILSRSVDRVILRTATIVAAVIGLGFMVLSVALVDSGLALRGLAPVAIAAVGWWRFKTGGSSALVFVVAMVAMTVVALLNRSITTVTNVTYGAIGLSIAGVLVARSRRGRVAWIATATGLVAAIRWRVVDESVVDFVVAVGAPFALILAGAQLMAWVKQEIAGRENRFENLFDHAPVAIWEEDFSEVDAWLQDLRASGVTDLRGYLEGRPEEVRRGAKLISVVNMNDAAVEFLQAPSRESVMGRLDADLILEDTLDTLIEEMVAVWEGRPHLRVDLTGSTMIRNPIDGFLLMSAPQTATGIDWSKVVVAMVDVREQRETQRRLEGLVDSKDQFVASVSHELRTPLAAVIGLAQELRDGSRIDESERDELMSVIAEQAMDVGDIVEDLLVAARADIGRVAVYLEEVNVARQVEMIIATTGVRADTEIIGDSAVANADPRRLRQILRNLVTNAERYGGANVEVSVTGGAGTVTVEVRDDGDGIPDELRETVFEPYQTAHHTVGLTGSVGLGLTVSRQLARLMDGDLTYHREDGHTVFRLVLPAA